jgi:hypothetical protein
MMANIRIGDGQMSRDAKPKKPPSRSGPRTSPGKKQMLVIMDAKLITDLKVAMAEDGTAASHVIEELVRDWLANRKGGNATK